jgi:hypothetical protein
MTFNQLISNPSTSSEQAFSIDKFIREVMWVTQILLVLDFTSVSLRTDFKENVDATIL